MLSNIILRSAAAFGGAPFHLVKCTALGSAGAGAAGGCDYCDGEGFITEDVEVYFYAKPYYMAQSEKECEKYQVFVLPILEDEEEVKTPVEFVEEAISVCGVDCSSCIHSGCWAHKQSRKTGVPVEKCRDYQKASLSWDIFDRMPKVPEFKLS